MGTGPLDAKTAIVSRSPGGHDVRKGEPFAGPSGRVLDHLLETNGESRDTVYLTNVVLCQTEDVPEQAIQCCKPRLMEEINGAETVVLAGAEAVKLFTNEKLGEVRGRRIQNGKRQFVATNNPAIILREPAPFPDIVRDFKRAFTPAIPYDPPRIYVTESITTAKAWASVIIESSRGKVAICDIEARGLAHTSELVSVAFSSNDREAYVFGKAIVQDPAGRQILQTILENEEIRWGYWNGKYDIQVLRNAGIAARIDEDGMLLSYSLDERGRVHSLDFNIKDKLDWPEYETSEITEAKKNGWHEEPLIEFRHLKPSKRGKAPDRVRSKMLYPGFTNWHDAYKYNGMDANGSYRLFNQLESAVQTDGTHGAYRRLLIPAANALAVVETRGLLLNSEYLIQVENEIARPRLDELTFRAQAFTGRSDFNLNSSQQCADYLYDALAVENPVFRRGKERSVDAIVRDALKREYTSPAVLEFVDVLDEFKKLDKQRSTYLEALARKRQSDGRVRTSLNIHGTETGRLSSSKPNLQNISRPPDDLSYDSIRDINIRKAFYAPEGHVILSADYSQAELRFAALLSADPHLLEVYLQGRDLHTEVAIANYGENFTKNQRVYAKSVNFGILYGIRPGKLSQMLHITWREAESLIEGWWHQFPQVEQWVGRVHEEARNEGELLSPSGRKRRFHLITDDNLDHTLKEAVNFYVQNGAS
ncbi:MAG TPA: DNA polymerase, partial [Nitrospiraceae bacterium]